MVRRAADHSSLEGLLGILRRWCADHPHLAVCDLDGLDLHRGVRENAVHLGLEQVGQCGPRPVWEADPTNGRLIYLDLGATARIRQDRASCREWCVQKAGLRGTANLDLP